MEERYTELYEHLSKLQWLLHRHHMMNHAEHGPFADPTRGQGRVLAMLKIQPEISTKDLSYLLGIRIPSLNELLNKLEKGDYIVRKPSEADKRVMIIHLTEKGKATQQIENDYSDIFSCLNEDELAVFEEHLGRVIAALEEQVGNEPSGRFRHPHGRRHGRGCGYRHGGHGRAPFDMPGAERFDPGYDGPVPDRDEGLSFDTE